MASSSRMEMLPREPIPTFPRQGSVVPTYTTALDQSLLGVPIREGRLLYLSTHDRFEIVFFQLYINGFAFSKSDGEECSMSVSPFTLVRNCRFQAGECARLKSFKLSMIEYEPASYFALQCPIDREAEEERADWVRWIANVVQVVTDSLLPVCAISCDPVPNVPQTSRRLLANYLVRKTGPTTIDVVYCELQAQVGQHAQIVFYENDSCETILEDGVLRISDQTMCCDAVGINSTCFVIDNMHFATRTPSERKLWLRAMSNVKVKIQNSEPESTFEELQHYRLSIREFIRQIENTTDSRIASSPLLRPCSSTCPFPPDLQTASEDKRMEGTSKPKPAHVSPFSL